MQGKEASDTHAHEPHDHPTKMEEVNGAMPQLFTADVILVRHKRHFMRYFLRKVTNSYWDHSAIVIFPKDPGKGFSSHVIVEAIQHGIISGLRRGTEVHKFEKYLSKPHRYDVGIKRLHHLDELTRERIRAFMLMNVDSPYYHLWLGKFMLAWLLPVYKKTLKRRQRYSCSSLIQKAFYEAVDWEDKSKVMFREKGDSPIELQELISPADLAESDVIEWIWNKK